MKKHVCVSGLGNVGLPIACILATSGYLVHGVDINEQVVARVNSGNLVDPEAGLCNLLIKAIKTGHLEASTKVKPAEFHIIAVPTLLDPSNEPDITKVLTALDAIIPYLREYDSVMIESTCPIGTTHMLAQKLQKSCPSIYVSYCPERILPGNILQEFIQNDRVIGGVDHTSTLHAKAFYQSFIKGDILATDARTAEAVKLAENAYRDINIAYANELSMIAESMDLDINELIRLANRHPRVQILNPGPGVGGHCIPMDPWYLVSSAPHLASLISKAREVNIKKTDWVVQKIRDAIKKNKAKRIACLGLTYKANVSDVRQSPALAVVESIEREIEVLRVDPYVPNTEMPQDAIIRAEIIVGLVPHQAFRNIPSHLLDGKIILDFAGVFA